MHIYPSLITAPGTLGTYIRPSTSARDATFMSTSAPSCGHKVCSVPTSACRWVPENRSSRFKFRTRSSTKYRACSENSSNPATETVKWKHQWLILMVFIHKKDKKGNQVLTFKDMVIHFQWLFQTLSWQTFSKKLLRKPAIIIALSFFVGSWYCPLAITIKTIQFGINSSGSVAYRWRFHFHDGPIRKHLFKIRLSSSQLSSSKWNGRPFHNYGIKSSIFYGPEFANTNLKVFKDITLHWSHSTYDCAYMKHWAETGTGLYLVLFRCNHSLISIATNRDRTKTYVFEINNHLYKTKKIIKSWSDGSFINYSSLFHKIRASKCLCILYIYNYIIICTELYRNIQIQEQDFAGNF